MLLSNGIEELVNAGHIESEKSFSQRTISSTSLAASVLRPEADDNEDK